MKVLAIIGIALALAACGRDNSNNKVTKLVVANSFSSDVHTSDCQRGLQIEVTVKGRIYKTPKISPHEEWDYELVQEKNEIPYKIKATCFTDEGKKLISEAEGKIPAEGDKFLLKGIHVGPPQASSKQTCSNEQVRGPCIVREQ